MTAVPSSGGVLSVGEHTPGPWRWFGNRSGGVYLATTHSGRKYVMGFQRYGMNGAQPTFRVGGIMRPSAELVEFEVGDQTVRGFKNADKDGSVYRYDVSGIDCADARLIAAAPDLLSALIALKPILDTAESNASGNMEWDDVSRPIAAARAAISAATAARTGEV